MQGNYEVQNKSKYVGTDKNPRYLSSYELEVFQFLDKHPSILEWGAEVVVVPYFNPVKQRKARYIVDIYVKYRKKSGEVVTELIEIKPTKDCVAPKKTGRKKNATYVRESATWITNQAKWAAAKKYAEERGMKFRILTENSIFG